MKDICPAIIGLGYVGLPIFTKLKNSFFTTGFDINSQRVQSLNKGIDINKEFTKKNLKLYNNSKITKNINNLKNSNFYIIAVPTPVDNKKIPNLNSIKQATKIVGKCLKPGDIVFLESTVYPSTTENICVPILEKISNLKYQKDFYVGYSSERINPGDTEHTIEKINKVISTTCKKKQIKKRILYLYKKISKKIVFSKSIKDAETSKVIENIQRDLNIALMNEIYIICEKLNLNFDEVKRLALSKWNFHNYSPGLVGGHCLPVDPYYLSYVSKKNKYISKVILSGRKLNNEMENYIKNKIIKKTSLNKKSKVLIYGITYKPNVNDLRNSLNLNIYLKLKKKFKNKVDCFDNIIDENTAKKFQIKRKLEKSDYDYVVILVAHKNYKKIIKKITLQNKKLKIFNIWK